MKDLPLIYFFVQPRKVKEETLLATDTQCCNVSRAGKTNPTYTAWITWAL